MSNANTLKTSLSSLLLALALNFPCIAQSPPPHKHIAVTQFIEHVAVDTVRKGLLEELEKKGYKEGENLTVTFDNAQGNTTTASQIARKFLGLKPDVIVALTTPSAQAMVKTVVNSVPIVFSAVTDPRGAGLVTSLKERPENVTGVMDAPPIQKQLAFIKTLIPVAKTIGVIYNPGDNGSVSSMEIIRQEAKAQGLTLIEASPVKSSDIQPAILQLAGKVDAIYVPLDNMIVSAMKAVSAVALKNKIPLFAADNGSVQDGALACVGYSYHQAGLKTGDIVAEILDGKKSSEIDIATPGKIDVFINRNTLETLKISLPEEIRSQAQFY